MQDIPLCFIYTVNFLLQLAVARCGRFSSLNVALIHLTWKVIFMVTITSACRVPEVAAFACKELFLVINRDKVVLRPLVSFLLSVFSLLHLNQGIVLPSFCPKPQMPGNTRLFMHWM